MPPTDRNAFDTRLARGADITQRIPHHKHWYQPARQIDSSPSKFSRPSTRAYPPHRLRGHSPPARVAPKMHGHLPAYCPSPLQAHELSANFLSTAPSPLNSAGGDCFCANLPRAPADELIHQTLRASRTPVQTSQRTSLPARLNRFEPPYGSPPTHRKLPAQSGAYPQAYRQAHRQNQRGAGTWGGLYCVTSKKVVIK